jgi:carbon monoxide dehydrogenase subunit G
MDFTNEFRVNLPPDQAWSLLTDVERIAPCMPGAQLTGVDGDTYNGVVKVKVGPMTVQYKGVVSFEEKDDEARTAVLHARGRDTRGQGNADARVTARLVQDGDGTRVTVDTHLTITGRIAQFGRGVIEEVSGKLLAQFVDNLEGQLATERRQTGAGIGGWGRHRARTRGAPGSHRHASASAAHRGQSRRSPEEDRTQRTQRSQPPHPALRPPGPPPPRTASAPRKRPPPPARRPRPHRSPWT